MLHIFLLKVYYWNSLSLAILQMTLGWTNIISTTNFTTGSINGKEAFNTTILSNLTELANMNKKETKNNHFFFELFKKKNYYKN